MGIISDGMEEHHCVLQRHACNVCGVRVRLECCPRLLQQCQAQGDLSTLTLPMPQGRGCSGDAWGTLLR
jgi:hypothetical protein